MSLDSASQPSESPLSGPAASGPVQSSPAPSGATAARDASFVEGDFEKLYDAQNAFVFRTLRLHGVAEASVEDAVQEVFVVVHRRRAEFSGSAAPRTWLYAICRRVAANFRRTTQRKAPGEPIPETYPSDAPTPAENVQRRQAAEFVREFSLKLSEERRDVFVLCLLEGVGAREAAEILEANVNTIYSRLRAVRAEFRTAAEEFRTRQQSQGAV